MLMFTFQKRLCTTQCPTVSTVMGMGTRLRGPEYIRLGANKIMFTWCIETSDDSIWVT